MSMLDLPGNIVKSIYALMLSSADPQLICIKFHHKKCLIDY